MCYVKKIRVPVPDDGTLDLEEKESVLFVTDDAKTAKELRAKGEAVLIYLHEGNGTQDFSDFSYAVEDPEALEPEFVDRVYRRLKGLPWNISKTLRCLIRETIPEDVDDFFHIYSDPAITKYMEGLYPEVEQEKQYIREYIEKVYAFYEFGVWTVIERASGAVIGRAGFAVREGYEEPELGFIIGAPWQGKGIAYEICDAILAYGWEMLGFERVQAMVEPGNTASLKLCEKLGFQVCEQVEIQGKEYIRLLADLDHERV